MFDNSKDQLRVDGKLPFFARRDLSQNQDTLAAGTQNLSPLEQRATYQALRELC